jgi:hypothetical protein
MKKTIYILTLLSLIFISKVNALPDFESDSITYVKDFNGDNIPDSIFIIRGYEGWIYKVLQIRIHSSLTGNSYKIQHTDYRAFHQFCSLVLLPDEMLKPQNNQLLDSIVKHYGFKEKEVTPALDWLMKGYQNYASSSDSLFSFLIKVNPIFYKDSLPYPHLTHKIIAKDTTQTLWKRYLDNESSLLNYALLKYYGHNHNRRRVKTRLDTTNSKYEIHSTAHGIYIKKNNQYAWVFHTDAYLTGGPVKLRFPSIGKIYLHDDYIVFHQVPGFMGLNRVFVIDILNGNIGKLNLKGLDFDSDNLRDLKISVNKNVIQIDTSTRKFDNDSTEYKIKTFDFNEIKNRLK